MVGTEATPVATSLDRWRPWRPRSLAAARPSTWLLLAFAILIAQLATAEPLTAADRQLRASGETVHRWQIGEADAYLIVGNVIMLYGEEQTTANQVLLVVDGEPGNVRTQIVAETNMGKEVSTWTSVIQTPSEPLVQAPRYRGPPDTPTPLLAQLGPEFREASQPIAQVQFQSPPGELPSPSSRYQDPMSLSEPIPVPLPDANSNGLAPLGEGSNRSPLSNDVNNGTVIANDIAFPEPPTTLPGGATTGGMQFFVGGGSRSVEILARGASMPPQIETTNRPETGETVIVARGGVTVLVRDVTAQLPSGQMMQLGTITLSADRIVGWLPLVTNLFNGTSDLSQSPGELYLEGDIVFRQGDRVIYADAMYYNIGQEVGMVLDAEAITTIPEYQGVVRLKADVLQQVSKGNFIAFDAAVTSSRLGVPSYWLQSQRLQLNDRERVIADPLTGAPTVDSQPYVTSTNNFVYFGGVPLLYWPTFSTPLEIPTFYISGAEVTRDSIFGTQVLLDFNLLQILGLRDVPPGVDWTLSTDYLSERGPAVGTNLTYNLPGFLGVPGPVNGVLDAWVIDDDGLDTLGGDRRNLVPEETTRGRALFRHRHYLPNDFEFVAEFGYLSDRNFLEQYFENEWDQDVDPRTGLMFNKYFYNNLFSLSAQAQVNDFFQTTEELPRFDHYLLGGSLLGDRLTYSVHNRVSYSKLNVADAPTNPIEAANFITLPGELDREGVVASTRQELALPLQTGPVKFVPFVSGEAARYGEAVDEDSLVRLVGQAGVRASLPMWRVDPAVQSSLLNVRGLAHKMEFTGEYFFADSNTNVEELPLYDPLDDDAQEQFRRRFTSIDYAGALPPQYDPRTYALRHGIQRWVASPSDTIADDLEQARIGIHNRWQTKRGLPGRERIVDLMRFDADLLLFPNADRDNFGETIGPATYDMQYNFGDRVAFLSDGYFDFFDDGLRSVSAGVKTSRPGLGEVYIGLLSLEGPISSTVIRGALDYRLNEKYIISSGATYDFGQTGNIGQSLGLTRIGESLLFRVGVNVDSGRDNVSVGFTLEPRFWPSSRLGRLGGQLIPPPGVEGLE